MASSNTEVKIATDAKSEKNFRWFNAQLVNKSETEGEYPVEHLYRHALSKENIAKYLEHYLVFVPANETITEDGEIISKPSFTIFPRYHQLRASSRLAGNLKESFQNTNTLGNKYLINHSAGSGKTLTIAWMADILDSLYNASNQKVFDNIIILTDRKSLDKNAKDDLVFIFSEYDNQLRREKCVAGMKEAMQNGKWCGKAPFGYEIVRIDGKNTIVINEKGKIFKKAFEWKAFEKLSSAEISRKLKVFGLDVDERRISEYLRNPFYCGFLSHKLLEGKLIKGQHEPLVSRELFIKAHHEVEKNTHGYSLHFENEPIPLKGFLKCDHCGQPMRGYVVKKKNLPYYKCNTKGCCNNKSGKELHTIFKGGLELLKLHLLPNTKEFLKKQVISTYNKINREKEENKGIIREQIMEVTRKLERLEVRFMEEEITLELYQKYGSLYKEELKKLEEAYCESGKRVSNLEKCIDIAFEMACNLHKMWEILTFKDKVLLQKALFPQGIKYCKKTDRCRTPEVNYLIGYLAQLSQDLRQIKNGESKMKFEIPHLVGPLVPQQFNVDISLNSFFQSILL